jgi:formate hydrogenlyase subunit 6/NADH:ubiquinone oxidoreductase subunit I
MKFGMMMEDALHGLFRRPATRRYPFERREAPPRLRGQLIWNPDGCVGCNLCTKECPSDALEVIVLDRKEKRFVVRYHVDRCTFCSQCVESCRFDCLELLSDQWELAATSKEDFVIHYGDDDELAEYMETAATNSKNAS